MNYLWFQVYGLYNQPTKIATPQVERKMDELNQQWHRILHLDKAAIFNMKVLIFAKDETQDFTLG